MRCPACGARFERSSAPGSLSVRTVNSAAVRAKSGTRSTTETRSASELSDSVWGDGQDTRQETGDVDVGQGPLHQARASLRNARRTEPVSHAGSILGFAEHHLGPAESGRLDATQDEITFDADRGTRYRWPVLDIRAVLGSSAALQFATRDATLWQVGFEGDSPLRWERMLQQLIRDAWRREGKGEVMEFKPRIAVR